ncbi:MAG: hypothetical protein ABIV51_05870 [Saprospiraceae bacterium]
MKTVFTPLFFLLLGMQVHAQTMTDGLLLPKKVLCTGLAYGHDSWNEYWEGGLKRTNGNIGTVTTQSVGLEGAYGLDDKVNILYGLPYVWTQASAGTLAGQSDFQDLTLALKYLALDQAIGTSAIRLHALLAGSFPITDYTPDFLPMSIGMGSKNLSLRGIFSLDLKHGFYTDLSAAYIWRSNVEIDRTSYFYDGKLINSNQVDIANRSDFHLAVGYRNDKLQANIFYNPSFTLGGDDIRRQDMPFVANNLDMQRVGALCRYHFTRNFTGWEINASASYVVAGRNVGQSTAFMLGLFYAFAI